MSSHTRTSWDRLSDLARRTPAGHGSERAPAGFAARVTATWVESRRVLGVDSLWEWLAVRSLAVACLLTVIAAIVAWPTVAETEHDELADVADPIGSEALPR